jgi:hypothetical protein
MVTRVGGGHRVGPAGRGPVPQTASVGVRDRSVVLVGLAQLGGAVLCRRGVGGYLPGLGQRFEGEEQQTWEVAD